MNKAFEKILEKLEEELIPLNQEITRYFYELKDTDNPKYIYAVGRSNALTDFKYDIKRLAEEFATDTNVGNNGWIPCSERLPEESGKYITWVEYDGDRFRAIDEIDCDGIIKEWNCSTDYKIIAWQPLPQPPKGE